MDISSFCLIFIMFCFLFGSGDANRSSRNRKNNGQDMYKEIDTLLRSWNRIGRRICFEERMSERKNNQIYECLRDVNDMESVSISACCFFWTEMMINFKFVFSLILTYNSNKLNSKGYENQLLKRCELHILKTRKLTKNQVRLAICRNNHHIIEKFQSCHTKMKENKPGNYLIN